MILQNPGEMGIERRRKRKSPEKWTNKKEKEEKNSKGRIKETVEATALNSKGKWKRKRETQCNDVKR